MSLPPAPPSAPSAPGPPSASPPAAPPASTSSRSKSTRATLPLQVRRTPRRTPARRASVGDYAIRHADQWIAAVQRKTPEDFTKSLVDGSLNYRLAELAALPAAAVVVEARYGALLDHQHAQPGRLLEPSRAYRFATRPSPTRASSPRTTPTATSPAAPGRVRRSRHR